MPVNRVATVAAGRQDVSRVVEGVAGAFTTHVDGPAGTTSLAAHPVLRASQGTRPPPLPRLSLPEAIDYLVPLGITVFGIVVYSLFVFRFYRSVARRDIFELRLTRYAHGFEHLRNLLRVLLFLLEHVLIYPFLSVVWFLAFSTFLVLLTQRYDVGSVLVVSMSVVTAIRVTAYYSEDLSRDLAKLLPLALLGAFLLEGSSIVTVRTTVDLLPELPTYWRRVVYYLLFLIGVEFVLRVGRIVRTGRLATRSIRRGEPTDVTGSDPHTGRGVDEGSRGSIADELSENEPDDGAGDGAANRLDGP